MNLNSYRVHERSTRSSCRTHDRSTRSKAGYTLVEMVISMAMLAIISSAILVLMVTGTRSFRRTKATVDLQTETQTLEAQLSTMIKEASYVEYDTSHKILKLYTPNEASKTGTGKDKDGNDIAVEYGSTEGLDLEVIKFNSDDEKLYFRKFEYDPDNPDSSGVNTSSSQINSIDSAANKNTDLMAEYVTGFSADTENEKKSGEIGVNITMKHETDSFSDSTTFVMRNGYADPKATGTPAASSEPSTSPT